MLLDVNLVIDFFLRVGGEFDNETWLVASVSDGVSSVGRQVKNNALVLMKRRIHVENGCFFGGLILNEKLHTSTKTNKDFFAPGVIMVPCSGMRREKNIGS